MTTYGTRTVKSSASTGTKRIDGKEIRPGANQEQRTQHRNAPSEDIVSASERTSAAIYIARRTQIIGIKLNVASTNAASRASRIPTSPIKEATDIEISPSIEA